jgi:hypothetical protein
LACHLQIDADPDPVPDPAYHFDENPDADAYPDFYLMRTWMYNVYITNPFQTTCAQGEGGSKIH